MNKKELIKQTEILMKEYPEMWKKITVVQAKLLRHMKMLTDLLTEDGDDKS